MLPSRSYLQKVKVAINCAMCNVYTTEPCACEKSVNFELIFTYCTTADLMNYTNTHRKLQCHCMYFCNKRVTLTKQENVDLFFIEYCVPIYIITHTQHTQLLLTDYTQ